MGAARVLLIALIAVLITLRVFKGMKFRKSIKYLFIGWSIAFVSLLIIFNLAVYCF